MHVEVATDERGDSAFVENFMCALAEWMILSIFDTKAEPSRQTALHPNNSPQWLTETEAQTASNQHASTRGTPP